MTLIFLWVVLVILSTWLDQFSSSSIKTPRHFVECTLFNKVAFINTLKDSIFLRYAREPITMTHVFVTIDNELIFCNPCHKFMQCYGQFLFYFTSSGSNYWKGSIISIHIYNSVTRAVWHAINIVYHILGGRAPVAPPLNPPLILNTTYIVLILKKYNRSKSSFLTFCVRYRRGTEDEWNYYVKAQTYLMVNCKLILG